MPQRSADVAGEIKLHRRLRRKIGGENAGNAELVSLEDGNVVWEDEGDVVHASSESGPIGPLASVLFEIGWAFIKPKAHSEEQAFVDLLGNFGSSWASEFSAEGRDGVGVVVGWKFRHHGPDVFGGFVLKNGGGGGVVKRRVLGGLVCTRRHVVPCRRLVAGDEDVGGLPWSEHEDGGGERLQVGGVGADHREFVVRNGEEKGLIQCGVDHSEKIGLAGVYRNDGGLCIANNYVKSQNTGKKKNSLSISNKCKKLNRDREGPYYILQVIF